MAGIWCVCSLTQEIEEVEETCTGHSHLKQFSSPSIDALAHAYQTHCDARLILSCLVSPPTAVSISIPASEQTELAYTIQSFLVRVGFVQFCDQATRPISESIVYTK